MNQAIFLPMFLRRLTSSVRFTSLSLRAPKACRVIAPAVVAGAAAVMSGCSDDGGSSSSLISVDVQVGQEDFDQALIRSVLFSESGRLSEVEPGAPVYAPYVTDNQGEAQVIIDGNELFYFDVYGRDRDDAQGIAQTTRRCQLVAGCGSASFGDNYSVAAAPGWRSVVYGLSDGERVRITSLTDLAAGLAQALVYSESSGDQQDAGWLETGYYSVYSVVQAESQISRLFGLEAVQNSEPADLTQLNELKDKNTTEATDSIRYGAILAAIQAYELEYEGTVDLPFFSQAVAADLITNAAQLYQKGGNQTISLSSLYTKAADNLEQAEVTNSTVQTYVDAVVSKLRSDSDAFADGELTTTTPASLATLLGSDLEDFELGITRAKAFVDLLRNYDETFFEDGYRTELDKYGSLLQTIGDDNADNLDALMVAYQQVFEFYRDCYLGGGCPTADSSWSWYESASYNNGVLTLNGGELTVKQEVADVNLNDSNDEPTSSQGIDVVILGSLKINDLTLELDYLLDSNDDIVSSPSLRVFYDEPVSVLQDPLSQPEVAYQIRWSQFALYDTADVGTDFETELTGTFTLSYVGVADPEGSGERRFNIEEVVLNSRISDVVGDDSDNDKNIVPLFVSAKANQAEAFYPEVSFASFNSFFSNSGESSLVEGSVEANLVSYRAGVESINGRSVEYFEYFITDGEALRYRFYPTVMREDTSDIDADDDLEELIATFDYEECTLNGGVSSPSVSKCQPKQRLNGERDLQAAVNELWELGVFSRPEVDGKGVYFVELPVVSDTNGCLILDTLPTSLKELDGTLYLPAQLGLSTARVFAEVVLDYDSTTEPKSLLDIQVTAPYSNVVNISAALSHDYTSVNTTGVYTGVGPNLDRIIFDFSTENNTVETSSIAIYKDGVSLTYADGTSDTVDSEILAGSQLDLLTGFPLYRYRVNEEGLLDRCVISNTAEPATSRNFDDSVFVINFRDAVYGKIANESGIWVIRYIDGSWETLN